MKEVAPLIAPLSPDFLEEIKTVLREKKLETIDTIAILSDRAHDLDEECEDHPPSTADQYDFASKLNLSRRLELLLRPHIKYLACLTATEDLIMQGKFTGKCNACGCLIARERLLSVPHTKFCTPCKSNSKRQAI